MSWLSRLVGFAPDESATYAIGEAAAILGEVVGDYPAARTDAGVQQLVRDLHSLEAALPARVQQYAGSTMYSEAWANSSAELQDTTDRAVGIQVAGKAAANRLAAASGVKPPYREKPIGALAAGSLGTLGWVIVGLLGVLVVVAVVKVLR